MLCAVLVQGLTAHMCMPVYMCAGIRLPTAARKENCIAKSHYPIISSTAELGKVFDNGDGVSKTRRSTLQPSRLLVLVRNPVDAVASFYRQENCSNKRRKG